MKKWMGIVLVSAFAAFAASAQTVLEEWTFDTEPNGTSFTNLINTGSAGAAHFGDDHFGTYVSNQVLRFTSVATNDCFRVGEMTTSGLDSGVYELSWTYPYVDVSAKNTAFGVFVRSKETYSAITKSSTDLFQFRLHVVSGVLNVQTRVLQPDDNAGIVNHFAFPPGAVTDVQVSLIVDLNNGTLNGEVVYAGATNTFSRQMLDLPADFVRVHGTPTKLIGSEYVTMDNIRWSFVEEGDVQDVILVDYQMDDPVDTEIKFLDQTGTDGGNFSGTNVAIRADGAGNLVFSNLTANQFSAHNLDAPITNGVVEIEYNVSDWDLAALSETGNNLAFEIRDSVSLNGVKMTLDQKVGGTRINWVGGIDAPREVLSVSNGVNLSVKAQIDLDAGTFAAFYNLGEGWILKDKDQLHGATVLDQIRLTADGTPAWGAGAYAKVNYFKATLPASKKLIDFQFSDATGTALKELWNNGSITSNWNFNADTEITADGDGNLEFLDVTNVWTRKVIFDAEPLTNNIVTMDWRVNAWDLQGLAGSDGIMFGLSDTVGGATVKSKFFLTADATDVRMTMTDAAAAGKQKAGFGVTNGTDGVSFRLVNDLDAETFNGYYKLDSESTWTEITTSNTVGLARVDEILLTVNPGWTGDATGFIDVDYLTLKETAAASVEPAVVPNITDISVSGSTVSLIWDSESGISYNVLGKAALTDPTWSPKASAIPGAGASTSTDVAGSGTEEFYTIEAYTP
jgi:hypothetical protein